MKMIVCGCFGRMGTIVCRLAEENSDMEVAAGIDIVEKAAPYPIYGNINECTDNADVIINFMSPKAALSDALAVVEYSVSRKIPMVVCTTGMPDELENAIKIAADKVAILRSANMSLGINLLSGLLKHAAKLLYENNFDIEIIEKHHNQKLDAPSGTALLLADSVNSSLDGMKYVNDRSQTHEKRERNEIGISAIRGGTIVGEHSIIFAGRDEVVEFTHIAHSRDIFAVGALKAARFIIGKPARLYSMEDITGGLT